MHEAAAPAGKPGKQKVGDALKSAYQLFKKNGLQWTYEAARKYRYALLALLAGVLAFEAYLYFLFKGICCELLALGLVGFLISPRTILREESGQKPAEGRMFNRRLFFSVTAAFLLLFPFFSFLHAIGLAPGLLFILAFTYLCRAVTGGRRLEALLAALLLGLFVWIWGEAGRPGLVVMPVDLPEGRDDLEFTRDGVANALETELENFGLKDTSSNFGQTEASKILAFDMHARLFPDDPWYIFPESPWYKGSDSRPASLAALYGSHVVIGTQVEGFPLSSVYHILRHLRGKPLLEAQILIGDDKSLTLALRRFNYPLNCMSETLARDLLDGKNSGSSAQALWNKVGDTNPPARVPDTLGCSPNLLRRILAALDIIGLPSGGEERVANVTVSGDLQADAQLTAALQLAALQAMERLSPERLALYYDNAGMYTSARDYFKKALPDMLREAAESPYVLEDAALQRLSNALIRIGDFDNEIDCSAPLQENPAPAAASADPEYKNHAYDLADKLLPGDVSVQARIGYGVLIAAKQMDWAKQEKCSVNGKVVEKGQLLKQAIPLLQKATDSDQGMAKQRYGLRRSHRTFAWANANLAYAQLLSGDTAAAKKEASDRLKNYNDLRAMIVKAYIESLDDCRTAPPLGDLYHKLIHDPPEPYTLHNNILMEEQLSDMYSRCGRKDEATKHRVLFASLLALSFYQRSAASNGQGGITYSFPLAAERPLSELEQGHPLPAEQSAAVSLRRAFLASTGQTSLAKNPPNVCSIDNLAGDDKWRKESLCAKLTSLACKGPEGGSNVKLAEEASQHMLSDPYVRANLGITRLKLAETVQEKGKETQKEKALNDFRAAVQLNGRDPKLRYLLGYTLLALNHVDDGKREMRNGELLDPGGWRQIEKHFQKNENSLSTCPSK